MSIQTVFKTRKNKWIESGQFLQKLRKRAHSIEKIDHLTKSSYPKIIKKNLKR